MGPIGLGNRLVMAQMAPFFNQLVFHEMGMRWDRGIFNGSNDSCGILWI